MIKQLSGLSCIAHVLYGGWFRMTCIHYYVKTMNTNLIWNLQNLDSIKSLHLYGQFLMLSFALSNGAPKTPTISIGTYMKAESTLVQDHLRVNCPLSHPLFSDLFLLHLAFGNTNLRLSELICMINLAYGLLPQSRAEQSRVVWPGVVLLSESPTTTTTTTPPSVPLQYRAFPSVLPQSRAEWSCIT